MIPNLFLICKNLCQDWSVTEAGVQWGEGRPRSCKLLNCSNLPVMAAAQSGGWTHAMHSSTFGSELGGEEKVEQVRSRSHTAQEVYSFGALVITTPPACHGQYSGNY